MADKRSVSYYETTYPTRATIRQPYFRPRDFRPGGDEAVRTGTINQEESVGGVAGTAFHGNGTRARIQRSGIRKARNVGEARIVQ